jgi:integral membrane protein (TIGR01906 family)
VVRIFVGVATALLIVAVAVLPFLTPAWLAFAQDRAEARAWTGYTEAELRVATDSLLHDLVVGPPAFDVVVAGQPVLTEAEREHLRDVRAVFGALAVLAVVAGAGLVAVAVAARRDRPGTIWSPLRRGALSLAAAVVGLGVIATVAFEPAFEVFHRLLFTGNYTFDPRTDRLVQIFPQQLWFETAIAAGTLIVGLGLATGWWAGRRAAAPARAPADRANPEAVRRGLGPVKS